MSFNLNEENLSSLFGLFNLFLHHQKKQAAHHKLWLSRRSTDPCVKSGLLQATEAAASYCCLVKQQNYFRRFSCEQLIATLWTSLNRDLLEVWETKTHTNGTELLARG